MDAPRETFPAVLERLYGEKYTGPIVVQFGQGVPSVIEFPQPSRRIRLDTGRNRRPDLATSLDSRD
jgi:hypothetical protein